MLKNECYHGTKYIFSTKGLAELQNEYGNVLKMLTWIKIIARHQTDRCEMLLGYKIITQTLNFSWTCTVFRHSLSVK